MTKQNEVGIDLSIRTAAKVKLPQELFPPTSYASVCPRPVSSETAAGPCARAVNSISKNDQVNPQGHAGTWSAK